MQNESRGRERISGNKRVGMEAWGGEKKGGNELVIEGLTKMKNT